MKSEARQCRTCGYVVPDADPMCPLDSGELAPLGPPRRAPMVVLFAEGRVSVAVGTTVLLGRDPHGSPYASLFAARDGVSHRHATLGLDESGQAWLRDEDSANGSFHNGRRLAPGVRQPLADNDTIRLAADVLGSVVLPADSP